MVFIPPRVSPQPTSTSEQLGSFGAYIQRPTPNQSGMTAQFFGENGVDSDTITALSLNKFQNIQVFVQVYLIKDPLGRIMRENGKYPIIAQFNGFVNRPSPKKTGMTAQFFAPNGPDANAVVELGKTEYQDALVFVDIRSNQSLEDLAEIELNNVNIINENYISRITKQQREYYQKREKDFKKMNDKLEFSTFFTNFKVLNTVGKPEDFAEWLTLYKTCCYPLAHKHCTFAGKAEKIPFIDSQYNYLPLCQDHLPEVLNQNFFTENDSYFSFKHQIYLKEWVHDFFKREFSIDGKSEPDPGRIIEWASANKIASLLPADYRAVN